MVEVGERYEVFWYGKEALSKENFLPLNRIADKLGRYGEVSIDTVSITSEMAERYNLKRKVMRVLRYVYGAYNTLIDQAGSITVRINSEWNFPEFPERTKFQETGREKLVGHAQRLAMMIYDCLPYGHSWRESLHNMKKTKIMYSFSWREGGRWRPRVRLV